MIIINKKFVQKMINNCLSGKLVTICCLLPLLMGAQHLQTDPQSSQQIYGVLENRRIMISPSDNKVEIYLSENQDAKIIQTIMLETAVKRCFWSQEVLAVQDLSNFLHLYKNTEEKSQKGFNQPEIYLELFESLKIPSDENLENLVLNSKVNILSIQFEEKVQIFIWQNNIFQLVKSIFKVKEETIESIQDDILTLKKGKEIKEIKLENFEEKQNRSTNLKEKKERILEENSFGLKENFVFEDVQDFQFSETFITMKVEGDYLGINTNQKIKFYKGLSFYNEQSVNDAKNFLLNLKNDEFYVAKSKITQFKLEGDSFQQKISSQTVDQANFYISDVFQMNEKGYLLYSYQDLDWERHSKLLKNEGNAIVQKQIYFPPEYTTYSQIKLCNDNRLIAVGSNIDGSHFFVHPQNSSHHDTFKVNVGQASIMVTDDECRFVFIWNWIYQADKPLEILIFKKNSDGSYEPKESIYTAAIGQRIFQIILSPDGDIAALLYLKGIEIVKYTAHTDSFDFVTTIFREEKMIYHLGMSQRYIFYFDAGNNFRYIPFSYSVSQQGPEESSYGKKGDFVVTAQPTLELSTSRQIVDLKAEGNEVFYIEKYSQVFGLKKEEGKFALKASFGDNQFFSSLDVNAHLRLVVAGNYDKQAYVYQDTGLGFAAQAQNPTIITNSQILAVDLNDEGKLALGHMNGDISTYSWKEPAFTYQRSIISEGSRIYAVKACLDGKTLALRETGGWFYLVLASAEGQKLQEEQLQEFVDVHFAASDDCSRVFLSFKLLQRVEVYTFTESQYQLFKSVEELTLPDSIAINSDADAFVVASHTSKNVVLFAFDSCMQEYQQAAVIFNEDDQVEASAVELTDTEVIIGALDGKVQVFDYVYSQKECDPFGKKALQSLEKLTDLNESELSLLRPVTALAACVDLAVVNRKYSGLSLYRLPEPGQAAEKVEEFLTQKFISSLDIVSGLNTFIAGTSEKTILVYIDSGEGYVLHQTLQTTSQVTSVDLTADNRILVGMINGDLAEFSSDGQSFSDTGSNTSNANAQVYDAKLCPDGARVVLLETDGVFSLKVFNADDTETTFTEELMEELIEGFLAASADCMVVAVSGISMSKVEVFKRNDEGKHEAFHTISVGKPLSQVAVEEDGDVLIVPSITDRETYIYQYTQCQKEYTLFKTQETADFNEGASITSQFALQASESGGVEVFSYSWTFDSTCPTLTASNLAPRSKVQQSQQKMETSSGAFQSASSEDPENAGAIGLAALGALLIAVSLLTFSTFALILVAWKFRKTPAKNKITEKSETANEIDRTTSQ